MVSAVVLLHLISKILIIYFHYRSERWSIIKKLGANMFEVSRIVISRVEYVDDKKTIR